jgi:hypothetical protein
VKGSENFTLESLTHFSKYVIPVVNVIDEIEEDATFDLEKEK